MMEFDDNQLEYLFNYLKTRQVNAIEMFNSVEDLKHDIKCYNQQLVYQEKSKQDKKCWEATLENLKDNTIQFLVLNGHKQVYEFIQACLNRNIRTQLKQDQTTSYFLNKLLENKEFCYKNKVSQLQIKIKEYY